ncbi:MAG: hypothetical protein WCD68_06980, partial [Candidatus Acidiferrum sp.]
NCPGPLSAAGLDILTAGLQAPTDGRIGYYLGEAFKIVRWDDVAIRRNAKDRRATLYGVLIWSAAALVIVLARTLPALNSAITRANPITLMIAIIVGVTFGFVLIAVITFLQLGLCHLIAKWFFGATGRFVEVMRPLLLGWFVNCFLLIPVAGMLLAAIGWTAVLMMVFEEVDGIRRLQAFGISAGINICFLVLQFSLMPVTHHL